MAETFRWVMYAVMMPVISLFGLIGNVTSICILHHHDIQLKKYFVDLLSSLAIFDILFLLTNFILSTFPNWGIVDGDRVWTDTKNTFPILVILFSPALYIFMTASIYMTVVLAVNRCLEIKMLRGTRISCLRSFLNSGMAQSLAVFLWATVFLLPRWFEYKIVDKVNMKNVTLMDNFTIVNDTVTSIDFTWLRKSDNYNLYYYGIMNPMCCMVIPLAIMVVSSILMLRQIRAVTASLTISVHQRNQEKRNRRMSMMLLGIIMLLVICHLGDMIIKCYQAYQISSHTNSTKSTDYNEPWMINFTIINNTLAVTNSSLNFAIYCKDSLFRQCARKICNKFLKWPTDRNASNSKTIDYLSTRIRGETKMTSKGETSFSSEAKPLQNKDTFRTCIPPN